MILEPEFPVDQTPAHLFFLYPHQPAQEAPGEFTRLSPCEALKVRLNTREGVAERRADHLIDQAFYVFVTERNLGCIAVVCIT